MLKTKQDTIIFQVTDNGIGIARDKLDKIFKPYYQITRKKSNLMGLGMGLSIVNKIVDHIDGKIEVESEENKGTSFILTFIKQEIDYSNKEVNEVKVSKPLDEYSHIEIKDIVGSNRFNILIVEDNKELLFFLLNSISHKYNVYKALNGKEAVTRLNDIPEPNLIISDIMMDYMDGNQFYNELIKQKGFRSVPFIFITAKSGMENRLKGIKQGAVDFISKPFHIDELISKIDSWIKVREAIKHETLLKIGSSIYYHIKSTENISHQKQTEKEFNNLDQLFTEYKISKKEIEIIALLKTGLEYKEISYKLSISINTVHTYMKRVFKKCKVICHYQCPQPDIEGRY